MPQTVSERSPSTRFSLWAVAFLAAVHVARMIAGRTFPGAWNDVGGILLCALIAYPHVPPARAWAARGNRVPFWLGACAIVVASAYCTVVLGR
jgi:hypothetical protein